MIILSISTSSDICSVALLKNETCIQELNISDAKTHSENLIPLIDNLLTMQKISLQDIDLLACDNGPGSFTGLRIGIATIKALSVPFNIPIVCSSSLEGLAYNFSKSTNNICSLIDAKNNQVYCGIFNNNYKLIRDYLADDINAILPILEEYTPLSFVGNAVDIHKSVLPVSNSANDNTLHAKNIGISSYYKFVNGTSETADDIFPMYLRKSQAERMKLLNDKNN